MDDHPLKQAIERVVEEQACDVYLYAGVVDKDACDSLIDDVPEEPKGKAFLILSTYGGDANAAYRLTRFLQNVYPDELVIFIPDVCKSAGTLIALGANELVFSHHGELGPLDVQLQERDEIWEYRSGLLPFKALEITCNQAFEYFEDSFLRLRASSGLQITTRTAAEIAAELAQGLVESLAGQIDPLRVADTHLWMRIAEEYGKRLCKRSQNAKEDTIKKLVYEYPSHGFVLDKEEAKELFNRVREPTEAEMQLFSQVDILMEFALRGPALARLISDKEFLETDSEPKGETNESPSQEATVEDSHNGQRDESENDGEGMGHNQEL